MPVRDPLEDLDTIARRLGASRVVVGVGSVRGPLDLVALQAEIAALSSPQGASSEHEKALQALDPTTGQGVRISDEYFPGLGDISSCIDWGV